MSKAKPGVFISHISREKELAQALKGHLTRDFFNQIDVFVSSDGKSIQAGNNWLKELERALKRAKVEIVLCSKESIGRPWVNFEIGAGWIRRGIQLIPVCHSDMKPHELPLPLNLLQAVEASQPQGLQKIYEDIAARLGMEPPSGNFEAMSEEIRKLEEHYRQAEQELTRIEHASILCAASAQYSDLDFDLDIVVLEKFFPQQVVVERQLTSTRLYQLLTSRRFDIIHLAVAVDADTGDLRFTPSNSDARDVDTMPAKGFANLLGESHTKLVVLATCYALYLAVEVAPVANMIATKTTISGREIAKWGELFYDSLAKGKSLYNAYETTAFINPSMKLIRQRDVAFASKIQQE